MFFSKPSLEENADPSDGLMTMLKKMYTEGDDEMRRSINKAWSESQEKRGRGDGMDGMGGMGGMTGMTGMGGMNF